MTKFLSASKAYHLEGHSIAMFYFLFTFMAFNSCCKEFISNIGQKKKKRNHHYYIKYLKYKSPNILFIQASNQDIKMTDFYFEKNLYSQPDITQIGLL